MGRKLIHKILVGILICWEMPAAALPLGDSTNLNDGPYLMYSGKYLVIKQMVAHGNIAGPQIDSLLLSGKSRVNLKISFSNHPAWSFSVKIKEHLKVPATIYPLPRKALFLSDIEGEFGAFRSLLLANKVIDSRYNWTFGSGHLVIAGDLFDRGKDVVQELWLIYKLEQSAEQHGGEVHTILGNHDIMNLNGDFRYVDPLYLEDAKFMGSSYAALYGPNTELGRWLRTKNLIEKIGSLLVLHGGISPEVVKYKKSLSEINAKCRPFYDVSQSHIPDSLQTYLGETGLFWYRGYFVQPRVADNQVSQILHFYRAKKIIVGHTIVGRNIAFYYGGKVLALDVDEHNGINEAAMLSVGNWYIINQNGKKKKLVFNLADDQINNDNIR